MAVKKSIEKNKDKIRELVTSKVNDLAVLKKYEESNKIEFFGHVDPMRAAEHDLCCKLFRGPNPRQKQLIEAWYNPDYKVFTFTGGNKCLTYNTLIDTPEGKIPVGKLYEAGKPFKIFAWNGKEKIIANASPPFKKSGLHKCYRITMNDGQWVEAADYHHVLMNDGNYATVERLSKSFYDLQESNSDTSQSIHASDAQNFDKIKSYYPLLTSGNKINSIKLITCQEVYDFEVDRYHNYFAGGLIHHNTGKTTIGTVIAVSNMIGYFPWDFTKTRISNPPVKVRYIGQDWEAHIKTVIIPALKKWWPKKRNVTTSKNNMGVESLWKDKLTGSTLEVMSNKQETDVFEGWDGDLVIYDEPPKRDIRIACARGLAVTNGRELFTATLLKEPWIDREVIKAVDEDGKPDLSIYNVHGDIYDNLNYGLTKEGIEEFAKKLSPEEREARLKGNPSYLRDLIYPEYNRNIHLKKRFKVPLDWQVDIAIDTHPAKEQAVLFMATDPRNYKYLIEEIWTHGDGTYIGEEIIRKVTGNAYRVNRVLIDHSAKGDSNNPYTTYQKIADVLWRYKISLSTYKKDEEGGIRATQTLLQGPNNEPSLFIFNDLRRTIFEIEGYMFDPKTFKPRQFDNDMMDNLYALANENTQWRAPQPKQSKYKPVNWKLA